MTRGRRTYVLILVTVILLLAGAYVAYAWTPKPVAQDPLVRMPGTQPGQVSLEDPNRCLNCHAGYNESVEPGFNWQGSMMAQAARDFLFFSCLTVAGQDSIWVTDTPNAVDLCERCHFPKGWLEGRSDPPNASAMIAGDFDGVQCDFCHRMIDPFFADTHAGIREGGDWVNYWDEASNQSRQAADATLQEDAAIAQAIMTFANQPFYDGNQPFSPTYTEATSGQYFVSPNAAKRASFSDAAARHQTFYSRFHKSKYMCATCHDVSNPVLANFAFKDAVPGDGTVLPTEENAAYSYFHVERTFSEFMLSDYGQQGGAPGKGPFAPSLFDTSYPNNYIAKCQDCHMRDVVGAAANKQGTPIRPNDSTEHPNSGQPLHDLTGGNVWVSTVLASAVAGSPNYDVTNAQLLNQGPAVLTLDLAQGQGVNPQALLAGADRARQQLQLAAVLENLSYNPSTGALSFRIQNQTGHKLISGFPEGRRIWINVKAYSGGSLIYEVNPYDPQGGTLKGLGYTYNGQGVLPQPAELGANETYVDELVYEMHPSSTLTGEDETFHFALGDGRYKDNRIPPKGFRIAEAAARHAEPVWHGAVAPGYFNAAEYAGGYDDVGLSIAAGADRVEVTLYYQTTSREYIEFLRDEINGDASTLPAGAYIIQTDPFFSQLKAWGDTIWALWTHNRNVDGAAPFAMTAASVGTPPQPCAVTAPTLVSATPGHQQVDLAWSAVSGAGGYTLYYDQNGKAQYVDSTTGTAYTDGGLTNGTEYCYKVTASDATCESGYSNVLCAVPNNQGQARAGVSSLETGSWEGRGGNRRWVPALAFLQGDTVTFRARVVDASTGLPVANAVVNLAVTGPEPNTFTTGPSGTDGYAEASWTTKKPKGGRPGTPLGAYTVTVTDVTASGYTWDGAATSTTFSIQ